MFLRSSIVLKIASWGFPGGAVVKNLPAKEYTNQFSLQSKGAVTVEDYWTECQYYDIV